MDERAVKIEGKEASMTLSARCVRWSADLNTTAATLLSKRTANLPVYTHTHEPLSPLV